MDFSSVSPEDMRVPRFQNETEKKEFMEAMFRGEVPIPIIFQAMGVDFTDERYVAEAMRLGGIGTLSAAAPGYRVTGNDLSNLSRAERSELFLEANDQRMSEQVNFVRDRHPLGILGGNVMKKLRGFSRSVDTYGKTGRVDILAAGAGVLDTNDFTQLKQFPWMEAMPIVSSAVAVRVMVKRYMEKANARIRIVLVELASKAGGHLGKRSAAEAMEPDDPAAIRAEIAKYLPGVPVVLAGGIAYRNQIQEALAMGFQGVAIGIRGLMTQESQLSDQIIKDVFLEPRYKVVTNDNSPTGYPGRYLEVPEEARTPEERLAYAQTAVRNCISCIETGECLFLEHAKDPHDTHFCIGKDLPRTRFGKRGGTYFVSVERDRIMYDKIYFDAEGNRRVPSLEEMYDFMMTHDAPPWPENGNGESVKASE